MAEESPCPSPTEPSKPNNNNNNYNDLPNKTNDAIVDPAVTWLKPRKNPLIANLVINIMSKRKRNLIRN